MTGGTHRWKTIEADGCTWEVRSVMKTSDPGATGDEEMLEFRTREGNRPPRRVAVAAGALETMDEAALRSAYLQARPIGGDFYGRPGKRMSDA